MAGRSVRVRFVVVGKREDAARPRRPVPEPSSRIWTLGGGVGVGVEDGDGEEEGEEGGGWVDGGRRWGRR